MLKVFYGKQGQTLAKTIEFPPSSEESIQQLSDACKPATFGLEGEAVYDESYRKAWAMDPNTFACQFQPAGTRILSDIQTCLDQTNFTAQLYKLNVYGPGGHFKTHVDTPRDTSMFGSLAVCLPSAFTGGSLVVRKNGTEHVFDWSAKSADSVQWGCILLRLRT